VLVVLGFWSLFLRVDLSNLCFCLLRYFVSLCLSLSFIDPPYNFLNGFLFSLLLDPPIPGGSRLMSKLLLGCIMSQRFVDPLFTL